MPLNEKARAGARRFAEDMQECVRLGLIVGYPGRLTPGETRISRARKELAHMREMDAKFLALRERGELLDEPTYAERFNDIHGLALDFFEEALGAPVAFEEENAKLLNIKANLASKVITTSARIDIARFKNQNVGVLARLLERMNGQTVEGSVNTPAEPELVGFDSTE